jgi:hypothetical protein
MKGKNLLDFRKLMKKNYSKLLKFEALKLSIRFQCGFKNYIFSEIQVNSFGGRK